MRKPGWYWCQWHKDGEWECSEWRGYNWDDNESSCQPVVVGEGIPTPDDVSWHEPTARKIREMCDGLTGNQIRWALDGALKTTPKPETQP